MVGMFVSIDIGQSRDKVHQIAEDINRDLHRSFELKSIDIHLATAMCVASLQENFENFDEFTSFVEAVESDIQTDDVIFLSELTGRSFDVKKNINKTIRSALQTGGFEMFYQPIYSIKSGRFESAEALIRMKDVSGGYISPAVFIPAAEKSGAIVRIGDFVLRDVFEFVASDEFKKLGLNYVEINLSTLQCMQDDIVSNIVSYREKYGVEPEYVNFEITETDSNYVRKIVVENMKAIRNEGFEFSLDDYGSGFSNLQRIMAFPYKIIKIDKSLVDNMNKQRGKILLRDTIGMIHGQGAEIVVEGVETAEAAEWLADAGCDHIQGFYYARPMPRDEFVEFIRKQAEA